MPVLTVLGPLSAALLTGSFVVEYVFAIPGMGRFFITAVTDRDYPLVMGVTLVYTALLFVANLLVDMAYGLIDPRVRTE
jgi:ABC-type dipeptide/oligopeptide/nickel transport system permease component